MGTTITHGRCGYVVLEIGINDDKDTIVDYGKI